MKCCAVCLLFALPLAAKLDVTKVAAATTIAVNVLEIRQTVHKARVAAKTAKRGVVKAAKKVAGK